MPGRTAFIVAALLSSVTAGAQQAPISGSFVSMLGTDTVAVERYTRTGSKLEGEFLSRYPRVQLVRYVADLGEGRFRGMSVATRAVDADPAAPALFSMVTLLGDTVATIEVQRGGRPDTASSGRRALRGRVAPSIPGLPSPVGLYEQILAFNSPAGRDSIHVSLLGVTGPATMSLYRRSRDTVAMISSFNQGWIEVASVDQAGRITRVDATATTVKTITQRAGQLDFDAVSKGWAAAEAARGRLGRMSPLDSVKATVGTANVEVVYGRPLKRGRVIWGNVVKWGEPWRTGANNATQLTTTADLVFGTTVIPAGKYTLWSLPTPTGMQLIINSQTGQWGTQYDPARDVARLDMIQTMLAKPVEQFTISVAPQAAGGSILRLAWDNREFSIPFRVR